MASLWPCNGCNAEFLIEELRKGFCRQCLEKQVVSKPSKERRPLLPETDVSAYRDRTKTLTQLGFKDYQEYLESFTWHNVRKKVFAAKGNKCSCCKSKKAWQIHHSDYSTETLSGESIEHLHPICRKCHREIEHDDNGNKLSLEDANRKFFRAVANPLRKRPRRPAKPRCACRPSYESLDNGAGI